MTCACIYIYFVVNITDVAAATTQTLQYLSVYVLLTFRYTSSHIHFFLLHNPFTIHPHPSMSMAGPPTCFLFSRELNLQKLQISIVPNIDLKAKLAVPADVSRWVDGN